MLGTLNAVGPVGKRLMTIKILIKRTAAVQKRRIQCLFVDFSFQVELQPNYIYRLASSLSNTVPLFLTRLKER